MIISGIVDRNKNGFGFLNPFDNSINDIYLPKEEMRNVLDGDEVEVIIRKKGNHSFSDRGQIMRIIKRANKQILGTVLKDKKQYILKPLNEKISSVLNILRFHTNINPDECINKIVKCNIIYKKNEVSCEVIKIIGAINTKEFEEEIIYTKYNLVDKFSKSIRKEINKINFIEKEKDLIERKDYTNLLTITIDPETAKDFDDAVSVEVLNNKSILYVHIADVSYYVKENTKLDEEAYNRGTSIYLIDKVIPMLPKKLSNNLCSLKEKKKRLTITVKAIFDNNGELENYEIHRSIIKSFKRFSYKEIDEIIENKYKSKNKEELNIMLKNMADLAEKLHKKRIINGSIDFDLPEPSFELDKDGNVKNTVIECRTLSHQIIEEFMLIANEIVARYLTERNNYILYRIHEEPEITKMKKLAEILETYGIKIKNKNRIESNELQKIIEKIKGKEEERFLLSIILRSMQQARYSPENKGHYGLSKRYYTHFTSPIRRYPDLIIHRILIANLNNSKKKKEYSSKEYYEELKEKGIELSRAERLAAEIERLSVRLRLMRYIKKYIGKTFDAYITGINSTGIYAELENTLEGKIDLTNLKEKNYLINIEHYEIKTKNRVYKLGQKIKVRLVTVDIINDLVEFEIG
ncbi:MAG TPA: ribonuclease R [bacterium]|nr:ribonuclease R [bacterium]HOL48239.1 ribonuclease R [bacterium]HPQ18139.1 ribonuclease R [bacterium]